MIQNIEKFIAFLIESGYMKASNVYILNNKYWQYYYNLIGYIDGKYFSVTISNPVNYSNVFVDMSPNVTDCQEILTWLCEEFGIIGQ